MVVKNIGRFLDDANETAISYKKYGETSEDKYPSFSVCFEGDDLYHFNESAIFNAYGIHLSDYEMMLNGETAFQYDYDPSSRRYSKTPLPPNYQPSVALAAGDLFQFHAIVKQTKLEAQNGSQRAFLVKNEGDSVERFAEDSPLYISYQSLNFFCMTRKESHYSNFVRHQDSVTLDVSLLQPNTKLQIFIHYPGQLIRSIDAPRLTIPLHRIVSPMNSLNKAKWVVNVKVSQTTVLRKRSIQTDPCNKMIDDHDQFLLKSVNTISDCIPPYWRSMIGTPSDLEECRSPEQLKNVNDIIKDYKTILEKSETPCLDMFSSVLWQRVRSQDAKICQKCISLEIVYLDKYYEKIKVLKSFGLEDFISNLGGFIGIFLGYSMMQIPRFIGMSTAY